MSGKPDPQGNAQRLFASFTHPDFLRWLTDGRPFLSLRDKRGWSGAWMYVYDKFYVPLFTARGREGGRAQQDRVSNLPF